MERAANAELLEELAIKVICLKMKEILIKEDNVKPISSPITLVGDVHGQFFDLKELFKVGGEIPNTNYLFLGDYVDRGPYSVETIVYLSLLKIKHPNRITLLRGNHESRGITQTYGFYMECQSKFGDTTVWQYITDMFDYLPISALIDNEIFCVHGGLSPAIETIQEIAQINRFQEIPHEGPLADIMWSDPDLDNPGFTLSARGAGYMFGEEVLQRFLQVNKVNHIIRAHQLCMEGYQVIFSNKLSTVWSAPNYIYRFGNMASILEIDDNRNFHFNVFSDAPENKRKDMTKHMGLVNDKQYFI
jgi:serine/threonine-protein phosphatase PPG1